MITSFLGVYPNYITWGMAREMDANGISIESHTVDHKSMTDLTDEQLRSELVDSKRKAEEELGHEVDYMAYPTGTYNLHIAQLVKEAGYKAAFTIKYGNVDKASNIYALERVPISRRSRRTRTSSNASAISRSSSVSAGSRAESLAFAATGCL